MIFFLPDIFELDEQELLLPAKKAVMMALVLKLIQPQQNPLTGEKFLAINEPDEVFGDQWVKLDKDFLGCVSVLKQNYKQLTKIELQIDKVLQKQARIQVPFWERNEYTDMAILFQGDLYIQEEQ